MLCKTKISENNEPYTTVLKLKYHKRPSPIVSNYIKYFTKWNEMYL